MIGDHVLGVLDVQHDTPGSLTEEDARLLQSIANQVAAGLRNARSFKQAQQQARRQALINEINQKIRGADAIEDVLQIAAEELGQALRTQRASISLGLGEQASNGRYEMDTTHPEDMIIQET
jgi:GAF domain-containing protein